MSFLKKIEGPVQAIRENGFKDYVKIVKLLNKKNDFTACGERWTPRLVGFLMKEFKKLPKKPKNRKFDNSILTKFQNYDTNQLTANEITKRREALRKYQEGILVSKNFTSDILS